MNIFLSPRITHCLFFSVKKLSDNLIEANIPISRNGGIHGTNSPPHPGCFRWFIYLGLLLPYDPIYPDPFRNDAFYVEKWKKPALCGIHLAHEILSAISTHFPPCQIKQITSGLTPNMPFYQQNGIEKWFSRKTSFLCCSTKGKHYGYS